MSEEYQYQCQSCNVVGELDEHYEQFDCPQCGGIMLPLNSPNEPAPYELDEDATIAIPRDELQDIPGDIKVAQAVDLGFGGMLTSSVSTGQYKPFSGGAVSPGAAAPARPVSPAPVAPVPVQPVAPVSVQPASPSSPGVKPPMKGKIVNKQSKKKSFSIGGKKVSATSTSASQSAPPAASVPSSTPIPPAVRPEQPAAQPSPVQPPQPAAAPILKKKQGFQIKKKGSAPQKFGKKKSVQPSKQPAPQSVAPTMPVPEPPAPRPTLDDTSTRSGFIPPQSSVETSPTVKHQPELETAAADQAAKFAALQAELEAAKNSKIEAEERARAIADETAKRTAEEVQKMAEEAAKKAAEEVARKAAEEAARIKAEEEKRLAEEAAREEAEKARLEALEAEREKIRKDREELEKQRKELEEQRRLAETAALSAAALATAAVKSEGIDKSKGDKADDGVKDAGSKDESDKKDGESEDAKGDDAGKDEALKGDKADDTEKKRQSPFGQRPSFGGKNKKGKGLSPLPYPKKKKRENDDEPSDSSNGKDSQKDGDASSGAKTDSAKSGSKDKTKSNGVKPAKRPLGKNGRPLPKKGPTRTATTTKTVLDEEELHPELLKIHKKKRLLIQIAVCVVLIVITTSLIYGVKWVKTSGTHPAKPKKDPFPKKKIVKIVPLATTPKEEKPQEPAASENSLDGAYKALRKALRRVDASRRTLQRSNKNAKDQIAAQIKLLDEKLKLYQDFLDKNEKDHPDDPNIETARKKLDNLKNIKSMY
ncbi:MAG: hypothetical protein GXP32_09250 [Kiritimatiellaeota bacterium]|nr:hypothetical protein [Kiritimatiellota bacterium]